MRHLKQLGIAAIALSIMLATAHAQQTGIVVNKVELTAAEALGISQAVGQPIVPGRYWYDPQSGLWGYEGGPYAGQLPAALPMIRGALQPDASGGMTRVFINGRAVHPMTLMQAQASMGPIPEGRYSMNVYGQIVMEGQPFPPLPQQAQQGGGFSGGNAVYLPGRTSDGRADGLHTGRASDGCTYIVTGDYSAESCP